MRTNARTAARRSAETRRCPSCGRGSAMVTNPYYGLRYCRWAERGLCEASEAAALAERDGHTCPRQNCDGIRAEDGNCSNPDCPACWERR